PRNKKKKILPFSVNSVSLWWILLASSHAAALPQLHYLVKHALRHFPFRGFGNLDDFALRNDRDRVTVGIKSNAFARNVVDDDCVERFRRQFLACVFQHVLRLGGKS